MDGWYSNGTTKRETKTASQSATTSASAAMAPSSNGNAKNSSNSNNNDTVILRIAVGSTNPAKLQAVERALQTVLSTTRRNTTTPESSSSKNSNSNNSPSSPSPPSPLSLLNVTYDMHGLDVLSLVSSQPRGDAETQRGAQNRARNAYVAYKQQFGKAPHLAIGLEGGIRVVRNATTNKRRENVKNVVNSKVKDDEDDEDEFDDYHDDDDFDDDDNDDDNDDDEDGTAEEDERDTQVWCMAWMAVYGKRQAILADLLAAGDCQHYYGDKSPRFGLAKTASFLLPPAIAKLILHDKMELGHADDALFGRVQSKRESGTVGILTDGMIDRADYYQHALILALIPWIRPDVYPSDHNNSNSNNHNNNSNNNNNSNSCSRNGKKPK